MQKNAFKKTIIDMNVKAAYNLWANQYDTNENKTRDLESISLRDTTRDLVFNTCLEIGCGTGKNTEWLINKAQSIMAVDLSSEMLDKAKRKIKSEKVEFIQVDVNEDWQFVNKMQFDLATFSLVLEHIEDLGQIFSKLGKVVKSGGYVYIGELHPFKQYNGSKARFETEEGLQVVTCFTHNISDFTSAAKKYGFSVDIVNEYFDENNHTTIPRILTLLFKKD
jgi:ubiquinone/menaquinone biosynthesis C-methylase UbiE